MEKHGSDSQVYIKKWPYNIYEWFLFIFKILSFRGKFSLLLFKLTIKTKTIMDSIPDEIQDFEENEENDQNEMETNETDNKKVIKIAPPKPVKRRQNILRVDHLISKRGIAELPEIIGKTQFKGKGHERDDLKLLLFKAKHWAHRLMPNLTFEDFVLKAEQLGNKNPVKSFLSKIRNGDPLHLDNEFVQSDGSDNEEPNNELNNQSADTGQSEYNYDLIFKDHIDEMNKKNVDSNDNNNAADTTTTAAEQIKTTQLDNDNLLNDDDDFNFDDNDL